MGLAIELTVGRVSVGMDEVLEDVAVVMRGIDTGGEIAGVLLLAGEGLYGPVDSVIELIESRIVEGLLELVLSGYGLSGPIGPESELTTGSVFVEALLLELVVGRGGLYGVKESSLSAELDVGVLEVLNEVGIMLLLVVALELVMACEGP